MPKGFTEDGRAILTKEEFMEQMLMPRGYRLVNGEWVLKYPELKVIEKRPVEPTKTIKSSDKKEQIVNNVTNIFLANGFVATKNKNILLTIGSDQYEIKITKKNSPFDFINNYKGSKDANKNTFFDLLKKETTFDIGIIDTKGTIGLTDKESYFGITITKKRK